MKIFVKKVMGHKAYYLLLLIQCIICSIRECNSAQEYDDVLIDEDNKSSRSRFNSLFGNKNRHNNSLPPEPQVLEAILKLSIRPGMVRFSAKKPQSLPKPQRLRRAKRGSGNNFAELVQDVCPSVSDWVARPEALDPYGNKLTVVQRIPVNGTVINQYFYETFCAYNLDYYYDEEYSQYHHQYNQETQCRGVDTMEWNSRCRENYIWTYGKVVTNGGDTGWSVIAIRGSCGCAIWPKSNDISGAGRGRRLSRGQHNREDNHIMVDPFF